jgi:hypothetical protein
MFRFHGSEGITPDVYGPNGHGNVISGLPRPLMTKTTSGQNLTQ